LTNRALKPIHILGTRRESLDEIVARGHTEKSINGKWDLQSMLQLALHLPI